MSNFFLQGLVDSKKGLLLAQKGRFKYFRNNGEEVPQIYNMRDW